MVALVVRQDHCYLIERLLVDRDDEQNTKPVCCSQLQTTLPSFLLNTGEFSASVKYCTS